MMKKEYIPTIERCIANRTKKVPETFKQLIMDMTEIKEKYGIELVGAMDPHYNSYDGTFRSVLIQLIQENSRELKIRGEFTSLKFVPLFDLDFFSQSNCWELKADLTTDIIKELQKEFGKDEIEFDEDDEENVFYEALHKELRENLHLNKLVDDYVYSCYTIAVKNNLERLLKDYYKVATESSELARITLYDMEDKELISFGSWLDL